jgi:rhodanese-related sulfurtransferase
MNRISPVLGCLALMLVSTAPHADEESTSSGDGLAVKITRHIESVDVKHQGKTVTIQRNQDPGNRINPDFARTSRNCPPFCIQPMTLGEGVETIGERDMLDYLEAVADGDDSILVIDSRTQKWVDKGTIPGSINIPYTELLGREGEQPIVDALLDRFDVTRDDQLFNFKQAKTLVFYCNGPWCGQSPTNIRILLKLGYPPHKLKYYRGGMQMWESLGLTTVKP